jgi:hypothetical protein
LSKRKDRERALATGMHYFNGRLVPVTKETYPGDRDRDKMIYLQCGKCRSVVSEGMVERHIIECQGGFAPCAKCKKRIPATDFVAHWKSCKGVEVKIEDRRIRADNTGPVS